MVTKEGSDNFKLIQTILRKLFSQNCFGGKKGGHRLQDRFKKIPIPANAKIKGGIDAVIEELNKKGLILGKKTKHGKAIFLNIKKLDEIKKYLQ